MKIKHVEELVGITRKNIRFYEEQGLLNPERAENGYREYHLEELEDQKEALSKMQEISRQIILQKVSLEKLDVEFYLEQMEQMEQEGTRFMDVKKTDIRFKKQIGASVAAIMMILFMTAFIGFLIWGNSVDPMPVLLLVVFLAIPTIVVIGIVAALIGRMKEIKGGKLKQILSLSATKRELELLFAKKWSNLRIFQRNTLTIVSHNCL